MGINKIGVIMNSRTKRVKKQIAGATDIGLAVSWPPPGPSGQKRLGTWKSVVSEKVVGVDISVLFHGLFGKKTSVVRQMLTVNPEASVKYVVAETMNQWFIQHELFHAKVVVFVHDPKLVQQWHCSDCKKAFDKAIAVKYEVTGRSRRQDAAVERDKEWKKKVAAFAAECAGQPEAVREATGKWLQAEFDNTFKGSVVSKSLHDAFVDWVREHNIKVDSAKKIAEKRKRSSTASKGPAVARGRRKKVVQPKEATWMWPLMKCLNSPIEADDQLAYLYHCGLVDVVLTVDTDLLAFGCFDIISGNVTSLTGGMPTGYTFDSVAARLILNFGISDSQWAKVVGQKRCLRLLLCLLSCIVGNDYVVTSVDPQKACQFVGEWFRARLKTDPNTWVPHDSMRRSIRHVAIQLWELDQRNNRTRKLKSSYKDCDEYVVAFLSSFDIYSRGRCWQFVTPPTLDDFLKQRYELVSSRVSVSCNDKKVPSTIFEIEGHAIPSSVMMKTIDFDKFPPECIPDCVLRFWLLAHGHELRDDILRREVVREVKYVRGLGTPPWDEGKYKSTWSTILQTMSGTSPRIPSLSWVESPKVWGVMDDLKHLSEALMRCSFKASIGKSTKELTKARIMNTDGQVYWDNFEVKAGATIVKGETVETILFRLQCVPSMKTNIYSVDMVFHERKGDSKLHLSPELSYCDCQRGAIASDMCGHRNATFFWLHTVRREWGQRKGTDGWQSPPNFYKLAAAIGLPRKILLMARIPIQSSELQTLLFQSSSASKKRKWGDATEEKVGKHNKEYLKHATDGDGKAIVQLVCQNLLQQHRRGEVDLREYEQAEFFTYLITQYTKRAQS